MLVLGLSGNVDLVPNLSPNFFHDAAACLIRDGELLAAVEEERFNRIKKSGGVTGVTAGFALTGTAPDERAIHLARGS